MPMASTTRSDIAHITPHHPPSPRRNPFEKDSRARLLREDSLATRRQCFGAALSTIGVVAAAASVSARESPKPPPRARLPDGDTQGSDYMELGGGSKSFAKPRIRYS